MQSTAGESLSAVSEKSKHHTCLQPRSFWMHDTVSALSYAIAATHAKANDPAQKAPYNDLTHFILQQQNQLPDFLQTPMRMLTLGFDLTGILKTGRLFHSRSEASRAKQIANWKKSSLSFQRDLIRYYESLATFALYNRQPINRTRSEPLPGTEVPAAE